VPPQLQGATDVGAGHPCSAGAAEVIGLDPAQFGGFFRLHQVVDTGTAAADPRLGRFSQLNAGDGPQQLAGLGLDPLAVNHVAGVMHRHNARERLQLCAKRLQEATVSQEFLHIQHRSPECSVAVQQLAVGLHRVAAAGGGYQHRIQVSVDGIHAPDEIRRELAGELQFALVMAHRSAAALIRWNYHLKTVGLQHLHRCCAHAGIEAALDAAQK
tara:strand:- start:269 stop:910 length:642 start_codon:yes stop_codon:yes gene_type:complete